MKSQSKDLPEFTIARKGSDYDVENPSKIEHWLNQCIESEGSERGPITVILCSDEALLELNQEYLNHNTYTDIITFDYSIGGLISGDLFISIDRISENAKDLSVDFKNELHRVLIHGVLHLCGYKDKSPEDQRLMRSKEDYYLSLRTF